MPRKHGLIPFIVTLLLSVCAAVALSACGKSPWCGTYYLNDNAIVIDENTITSGENSQGYTISGNVMRLDNGAEFRFANDYRVLYSPSFLFMRHGTRTGTNMFTTRSGPWDGRLVPDPLAKYIEIFDFYPDGTYKYFDTKTVTDREGDYTLNSGVLVLFQFADDGSDGIFYIDESYDIYFYAYVKDITEFTFFPDENGSEEPPGENEKFTVTLKWNIPDMPDTVTEVYAGDPYTLPAPSERPGYTFEGWSTTVSGQSPAGETLTVDGDITCYAQWHLNEYRITFVTEHDETPSTITFTVNTIQSISLPSLEDDLLTFRYWALDEEGEERVDSVTELKDYTLYAVWAEIPPYHTGDRAHLGLAIGETCPTCGLRVEYKTADAVLMVNDEKEYGCGEYYGETAGDQLDRYAHKVNYIYLAQTIQQIGDSAFYEYGGLITVSIEEKSQIVFIGGNAFEGCSSLTSIEIPSGVTSLGSTAVNTKGSSTFLGCKSLRTVTFAAGSQLSLIGYAVFMDCNGLTSIEIPSSVTTIGPWAFAYCDNLQTVTFAGDSRLSSIWYHAFERCVELTSIEIPGGVTSISDQAFEYCENLQTVTFGADIQLSFIGPSAFEGCENLQTVFYGGDAAGWNDIQIGSNNQALLEADLYFYSAAAPEKDGKFWHYGADGKTPEIWADKKTL